MTTNVVKLATVKGQYKDERNMDVEYDPVFFPKEAIQVGTKLRNYGRRDPGSWWTVSAIRTYVKKPSGHYQLERAVEVKHLSDIITLKRDKEDPAFVSHREPTFGSISYSAIWRLA